MTIICKIQNPQGVTLEADKTPYQYSTTGDLIDRIFVDQSGQIDPLGTVEIEPGKNTLEIAFGLIFSYQQLSVDNLFPCTITIPPGVYETSHLLREIEDQLNSLRVYGDIRDADTYMYGGYLFPQNYGGIGCTVRINESGYFTIDFSKDNNIGDLVHAKVYTGQDLFPTPLDYFGSLPDKLGFVYSQNEDNSNPNVLYNKYLYPSTYDSVTKKGSLQADIRKLEITDISKFITLRDQVFEVVENKNTLKFGMVLTTRLQILFNQPVSVDNLYIVNVSVPPGRYTIDQIVNIVQQQINEPRLYIEENNVSGYQVEEYAGGGFNFSNYNGGSVEFSLSLTSSNTLRIYAISLLNPTYFKPVEIRFAYYTGPDAYPTPESYEGSLADILKLERQTRTFDDVKYDMDFYRTFPGTVDVFSETQPYLSFENSIPLYENQSVKFEFELQYTDKNSGDLVTTRFSETYAVLKYTFTEIKRMIEKLIEEKSFEFAGVDTQLLVDVIYDQDLHVIKFKYTIRANDSILVNGIRLGFIPDDDQDEYDISLARCIGISKKANTKQFMFDDAWMVDPVINFRDKSGFELDDAFENLSMISRSGGPGLVISNSGMSYIDNLYTPKVMEIDADRIVINSDLNAKNLDVDLYSINKRSDIIITSATMQTPSRIVLVGEFYPNSSVKLQTPERVFTTRVTRFVDANTLYCEFAEILPPGIYTVVVISLNGNFTEKLVNIQLTI